MQYSKKVANPAKLHIFSHACTPAPLPLAFHLCCSCAAQQVKPRFRNCRFQKKIMIALSFLLSLSVCLLWTGAEGDRTYIVVSRAYRCPWQQQSMCLMVELRASCFTCSGNVINTLQCLSRQRPGAGALHGANRCWKECICVIIPSQRSASDVYTQVA